jgi:hypothetical protein
MRRVLRLYLLWPRIEVIFVSLLPIGLIAESSIANSAAYGFSGFGSAAALASSVIALLRGFFFEVLTYVCVRTAHILVRKGVRQHKVGITVMSLLGGFAVLVSAVNNLGWVLNGHDLLGIFDLLGHILPSALYHLYEVGLAVLLPLAVGGVALVDLDHFVHDLLQKDHLDNAAVLVEEREMHRTAFLQSQRKQRAVIREAYDEIASDRAQDFVERVRVGDMTFGSTLTALPDPSTSPLKALPSPVSHKTGTGTVWPVEP